MYLGEKLGGQTSGMVLTPLHLSYQYGKYQENTNRYHLDIQPPGTNSYFKYEFVPATPATAVGETRQPT